MSPQSRTYCLAMGATLCTRQQTTKPRDTRRSRCSRRPAGVPPALGEYNHCQTTRGIDYNALRLSSDHASCPTANLTSPTIPPDYPRRSRRYHRHFARQARRRSGVSPIAPSSQIGKSNPRPISRSRLQPCGREFRASRHRVKPDPHPFVLERGPVMTHRPMGSRSKKEQVGNENVTETLVQETEDAKRRD